MTMKYLDEFRDTEVCTVLAEKIRKTASGEFRIMEVCGGHTMSIRKHGIHRLVGDDVKLISGPGCPVCVTSIGDIDKVLAIAFSGNATVCVFGDLFYVPGSEESLSSARAKGCDIRIVYSVHDVLEAAKEEPDKEFVFISIGFETTAPTAAAAILMARKMRISNFSILGLNKTMPNALRAVLESDECKIDAFLLPGHVSTITGMGIYDFIPEELGVSCCVSGFEPADILLAIQVLVGMKEKGEKRLVNAYERAVKPEGNTKARDIMYEVFERSDAEWRGLGNIGLSGLMLKETFNNLDAEQRFDIRIPPSNEFDGCICGDILRGSKAPCDCGLFGTVCTPEDPKGACMVSSEGTCAAWHKYGGDEPVKGQI